MTPEEIKEINRLIAEEVMRAIEGDPGTAPAYQIMDDSRVQLTLTANPYDWFTFDPYHRIEQAMMALEKFENYNLHKRTWHDGTLGYRCSIENPVYCSSPWADTPSAAICSALLEAVKGE